ncbi:MAG: glycosyltransferase [bacterium]
MSTSGLTVCLIIKNERSNLQEVLPDLVLAADDVVVVDTGSSDGSVELARALGARVFTHPWNEHFADARNRGLEEVATSHAMWLDADDRIDRSDLERVRAACLEHGPEAGFTLILDSDGAKPEFRSTCRQLRVFPARPEHRFTGRVHEQIQPSLERTGTRVVPLDVTVRHLGYSTDDIVRAKSRRNLELCRREWIEGAKTLATAYHYVQAASLAGEYAEGANLVREVLAATKPDSAEDIVQNLRVTLGHLEEKQGRIPRAESVYRHAVSLHARDPWAAWHLGDLLARTGRGEEAIAWLEVAASADPLSSRVPLPLAGVRAAAENRLRELRAGTPA